MLSELGIQPFSVTVDASNHNKVKLFPLVIRFFNAKVGVRVRLLDLRSMASETSQQNMDFIVSSFHKNGLDPKQLIFLCRQCISKFWWIAAEWTK